jgi:hypothetical protein
MSWSEVLGYEPHSCEICGAVASHLCARCGKWLCDSGKCGAAAARQVRVTTSETLVFGLRHPVRAARILPFYAMERIKR